jgi:hypothetical protein
MDAYIGLKTVYVSVLFMYSLYLGLDEDCLQHDVTLIYRMMGWKNLFHYSF